MVDLTTLGSCTCGLVSLSLMTRREAEGWEGEGHSQEPLLSLHFTARRQSEWRGREGGREVGRERPEMCKA